MGRPATDQTRTILDAAQRILADRGPRAMTMDAVAAEAGVGKGTVFLYWPSKTRLLQAVISLDLASVALELTAQVRAGVDELSLGWLVESQLWTAWSRPLLVDMLVDLPGALEGVDDSLLACRPEPAADHLPDLVAALQQAGVVDRGLPLEQVVDDVGTLLVGAALRGITEAGRREQLAQGVRRLLGSVYAPPADADRRAAATRVAAILEDQVDDFVALARPDRPTTADLRPRPISLAS